MKANTERNRKEITKNLQQIREELKNPRIDFINNPPHYKANGLEVIEVIDAFELDFYTGTIVAYILRAGRKEGCTRLEDLKKAQWYLNREIKLEQDDIKKYGEG